jgi:hypothetical protein
MVARWLCWFMLVLRRCCVMAWFEGAKVLKYLREFSQRRQNFPAPRRGASRMSLWRIGCT